MNSTIPYKLPGMSKPQAKQQQKQQPPRTIAERVADGVTITRIAHDLAGALRREDIYNYLDPLRWRPDYQLSTEKLKAVARYERRPLAVVRAEYLARRS